MKGERNKTFFTHFCRALKEGRGKRKRRRDGDAFREKEKQRRSCRIVLEEREGGEGRRCRDRNGDVEHPLVREKKKKEKKEKKKKNVARRGLRIRASFTNCRSSGREMPIAHVEQKRREGKGGDAALSYRKEQGTLATPQGKGKEKGREKMRLCSEPSCE